MLIDKGYKKQITVTLYEDELAVLDGICSKFRCSRAAVLGTWCDEHKDWNTADLTGKVKAGRRPGGGRKPSKGKTP